MDKKIICRQLRLNVVISQLFSYNKSGVAKIVSPLITLSYFFYIPNIPLPKGGLAHSRRAFLFVISTLP